MKISEVVVVCLLLFHATETKFPWISQEEEPQCVIYSRFDYEVKVVQKLGVYENLFEDQKKINDEQKQRNEEQEREIGDLRTELKNIKEEIKGIAFILTLLHSDRPKLYTIIFFLSAVGLVPLAGMCILLLEKRIIIFSRLCVCLSVHLYDTYRVGSITKIYKIFLS